MPSYVTVKGRSRESEEFQRPSERLDLPLAERARLTRVRATLGSETGPKAADRSSKEAAEVAALLAEARQCWREGDHSVVLDKAKAGLRAARRRDLHAAAAAALLVAAESHLATGDSKSAEEAAFEAVKELAGEEGKVRKKELGAAAADLVVARAHLVKCGIPEVTEVQRLLPSLGLSWGEVATILSHAEASSADPAEAADARAVLEKAKREKDEIGTVQSLYTIALSGQPTSSLTAALNRCRELGAIWRSPKCASISEDQKEAWAALSQAQAELKRLKQLGSPELWYPDWLLTPPGAAISPARVDAAKTVLEAAESAVSLFYGSGSLEGQGLAELVRAEASLCIWESSTAATSAEAAYTLFQRLPSGHVLGEVSALKLKAQACWQNEDLIGCLSAATEALELCEDIGERALGASLLRLCAAAHLDGAEPADVYRAATGALAILKDLPGRRSEEEAEAQLLVASSWLYHSLCPSWRSEKPTKPTTEMLEAAEAALQLLHHDNPTLGEAEAMLLTGIAQAELDQKESARTTLGTARALFHQLGDIGREVNALLKLASVESEPEKIYEEASQLAGRSGQPALRVTALQAQAKHWQTGAQIQEELKCLQQAVQLASGLSPQLHAEILQAISRAMERMGYETSDRALHSEREAIKLLRSVGSGSGRGHGDGAVRRARASEAAALRRLATLLERTGDKEEASKLSNESLAVFRVLGDVTGERDVLVQRGETLVACGRSADALPLVQQAYQLCRADPNDETVGEPLFKLAKLCLALNDLRGAVECGKAAEAVFSRTGDMYNEGLLLLEVVSSVHSKRREYQEARLAAEQAALRFHKMESAEKEAAALEVSVRIQVDAGELDEAFITLNRAIDHFRTTGARGPETKLLVVESEAHVAAGNAQEARRAAESALSNLRSLAHSEKSIRDEALAHIALARAKILQIQDGQVDRNHEQDGWQGALHAAKEAAALCNAPEYAETCVQAKLTAIEAQLMGGQGHEALHSATALEDTCKRAGDRKNEAQALLMVFHAQFGSLGRIEPGRLALRRALDIFWEIQDGGGTIQCFLSLAELHTAQGQSGAAKEAAIEAYALAHSNSDKYYEAESLRLLAGALLELEENPQQGENLKDRYAGWITTSRGAFPTPPAGPIGAAMQAVEAFRALGDKNRLASSLHVLAGAFLRQGQHTQAASVADEAVGIRRSIGDRWGEAESLLRLASAQLETGQAAEAIQTAESTRLLARELGEEGMKAEALELIKLAQSYEPESWQGLATHRSKLAAQQQRARRRQQPQQGQRPEMEDRKKRLGGPAVPFDRKPFPWTVAGSRAGPGAVHEREAYGPRPPGSLPGGPLGLWADDSGGPPKLYTCARCGASSRSVQDGVPGPKDSDFQWICRGCARAGPLIAPGNGQKDGPLNFWWEKPEPPKPWAMRSGSKLSEEQMANMSLIELYKHARSIGIDFKELGEAMESKNPTNGVIELLRRY